MAIHNPVTSFGLVRQVVFRRGGGVTIDGATRTAPGVSNDVEVLAGDLVGPWTIRVPQWARAHRILAIGGGGGGGGGASSNAGGGGGGGSGGWLRTHAAPCVPDDTLIVQVGSGGAAGAAAGAGGNGTPSYVTGAAVTTVTTLLGGGGAAGTATGGAGGGCLIPSVLLSTSVAQAGGTNGFTGRLLLRGMPTSSPLMAAAQAQIQNLDAAVQSAWQDYDIGCMSGGAGGTGASPNFGACFGVTFWPGTGDAGGGGGGIPGFTPYVGGQASLWTSATNRMGGNGGSSPTPGGDGIGWGYGCGGGGGGANATGTGAVGGTGADGIVIIEFLESSI